MLLRVAQKRKIEKSGGGGVRRRRGKISTEMKHSAPLQMRTHFNIRYCYNTTTALIHIVHYAIFIIRNDNNISHKQVEYKYAIVHVKIIVNIHRQQQQQKR